MRSDMRPHAAAAIGCCRAPAFEKTRSRSVSGSQLRQHLLTPFIVANRRAPLTVFAAIALILATLTVLTLLAPMPSR
jgi:hypothetical protein